MSFRTYHDQLHRGICLDKSKPEEAMVMELIDSAPFQRLRRIKQLGPAFLTFHGAESSRFTHSIGVFYLARRALKKLEHIGPHLKKYRALLYGSALLHDLGHSPLSHTGEEIFGENHENWSARIVREHSSIRKILEKFQPGTADEIAGLLDGTNTTNKAIKALVSSQLDCDRLDYLLRDSHSTGTKYGQLDLERILSALTLAPDGDLAIHPKGLMAVEHYLVVRNLMYRSVYNHRVNEVCNWLLDQIVLTARQLGAKRIWADECMSKWLWSQNQIDLETFLNNDDIRFGYHLMCWKEKGPPILNDLCRRFLNRNLLNAINIEHLSNELKLNALTFARRYSEQFGLNPDIYCGIRIQRFHSYQPYKSGLRLWDGEQLQAIEKVSKLVEQLIKPEGASWLIHPKEIHLKLKKKISTMPKEL